MTGAPQAARGRSVVLVALAFVCALAGCGDVLGIPDATRASAGGPDASLPDVDAPDTAPGPCGPGRKTCDGGCATLDDPNTGCADPNTCAQCSVDNAIAACVNGQCAPKECIAGFADCNTDPADGCETQTAEDDENCGRCEFSCSGGHCHTGVCHCSGDTCAPGVTCDPNGNCAG